MWQWINLRCRSEAAVKAYYAREIAETLAQFRTEDGMEMVRQGIGYKPKRNERSIMDGTIMPITGPYT